MFQSLIINDYTSIITYFEKAKYLKRNIYVNLRLIRYNSHSQSEDHLCVLDEIETVSSFDNAVNPGVESGK